MMRRNFFIVSVFLVFTLALSGMVFGQRVIDLNKFWGDMRVLGDEGDLSGAVAYGDINGDGYHDIIIGAYGADPGDPPRSYAGETYVIFGSSSPPSTFDLSTQSADITISGDDNEDYSGRAVASGDVNGDGYDDIIIGADGADPPGGSGAGKTYVIFGVSFPSPPYTIDLRTDSADITICGDDFYDHSGHAVACGDMNGDGYDDIIIGAHFADPPGGYWAGETYVIFGSSSPPSIIDLSCQSADITVCGAAADDISGRAVASGDINGDGYDDIIIGAPWAVPPGGSGAGETYVIFGSSSPPSIIDLSTQSADITIYGVGDEAWSGHAVASGDVNNDSYDDIIIGAYGADPGGRNRAGETYVIFGSSSPPSTFDLSTQSADITVCGAAADDVSGWAVASGDINGDGYDDVIIGAPSADPGWLLDAGETYVIFGESFSSPPYAIDLNTQSTDITVCGKVDFFAYALASGDINGDGYDDVIIGAPWADPGGRTGAGETYLISGGGAIVTSHGVGGSGWVRSFSLLGRTWGELQAFLETGEVQLAVGDMDGDGHDEIAAGHGEGGSSLVKLFEVDGSFIHSFYAFDSGKNPGGEVHLVVGNFDADPTLEIAAATGYNGGNRVRLFETDGTFISQFAAFGIGGNANGEVQITAADIDSDGIDEIICGHGEGGSSWVKLFEVDGSLIRSFRAFGAVNANGEVHLAIGNFDADPSDMEIAVAHGEGGKSWVKFFNADGTFIRSFKAFALANAQGEVHLAAADIDNDGVWEIICGHGEGGSSMVKVFKADGTVIRSFKAFGAANSQGEVHLAKSNY